MLPVFQALLGKPKDSNIRLIRGGFATLTLLIVGFALYYNVLEVQFGLPKEFVYIFLIFPIIGLIRALLDPGVFRKKVWKWVNVFLGVSMIALGWWFVEDRAVSQISTPTESTASGISLSSLSSSTLNSTPTFNADLYLSFLGWILLVSGLLLNNKNITTKNERYGETIKKIRV